MMPEMQYGFPVVNAENILSVLKELGIKRWERKEDPIPLDDYLARDLSEEEKADLRFVPKVEVLSLKDPKEKTFRGFRLQGRDATVVFSLLPGDLVPVCGEFRHGTEEVVVNLPGGVVGKNETPLQNAGHEFKEETGIALKEIISLTSRGIPRNARMTTAKNHFFIAVPREPIEVQSTQLDESEFLKVVLLPLEEWLKVITHEKTESFSIVGTFLALQKLGKINI